MIFVASGTYLGKHRAIKWTDWQLNGDSFAVLALQAMAKAKELQQGALA